MSASRSRRDVENRRNQPKQDVGHRSDALTVIKLLSERKFRVEFRAKRDGRQLVAIVCEGAGRRVYLPASDEQLQIADNAKPKWKPEERMNRTSPNLVSGHYDLRNRVLVRAIHGEAVGRAYDLLRSRERGAQQILEDARAAGLSDDGQGIESGGTGILAYTETVTTYLGVVGQ